MAEYGLTESGFYAPTATELRDLIKARVWRALVTTLDLSDRSLEGQLVAIVAEALQKLWSLGQQTTSAYDPDKATGAALDALCLLTGTFRRGASASRATLTLTGTPTSVVNGGAVAKTSAGVQFSTDELKVIAALAAYANTTAYLLADRVTRGGNAYQCVQAGTSAGSGGPSHTSPLPADDVTDGTVKWRFLGAGAGAVDVTATATETGPLIANAGTVTERVSAIGGWSGVTNVLDAAAGRNQMKDPELRRLREFELAEPGTSPIDAIRAALYNVEGVTSVYVFVNNTDITDADGMPPNSVEAMVQGGDPQAIRDTLLANVAAGIRTHGNQTGTATDSQGTSHVIKFTRPVDVQIYVKISLIKQLGVYPLDGAAQVKAAIVGLNSNPTGRDAVAAAISARAFSVLGVLDVPEVLLDTVPGPVTSNTVVIQPRQRAVYDTSHIAVTETNGTP